MTPHRSEVFPLLRRNFQFYKFLIIKRQAKKPLRIFPELRTYNSNVALWHSLCEKKVTELTIHIIFIVARTFLKYWANISGG